MKKQSDAIGSGTADPMTSSAAASPLPAPQMQNKPAPGQKGPRGLSPRTSYSRVNTGSPPQQDAGAISQKSLPPRGMEFLPRKVAQAEASMKTMIQRPALSDMVKAAMSGTLSKLDLNAEIERFARGDSEKTAADEETVTGEQVEKLAEALDYLAKLAEDGDLGPGKGPNALEVSPAQASGENIDAGQMGHATSKNLPPVSPSTQPEQVQAGKANTGMQTNDEMSHGEQPIDPMGNESASNENEISKKASSLLERLGAKTAGKVSTYDLIKEKSAALKKRAEDAINPAQISGGKASSQGEDPPIGASAAGEGELPAEPSDVTSQKRMISSNEAAINYTKREAKADPKKDLGKVHNEPALSAAHDTTLQKTLTHTGEAGAKIASNLQTNAARALLSKLASEVSEKKKTEAKEKESNMAAGSGNPQSASGFNAATVGGGGM